MNTALWIVQALVALAFVASGAFKLARPKSALASNMGWVEDFSPGAIKLIGAAEVAGGAGVVLPWLTGIAPVLTPLAAGALVVVMLGAVATHLRRGERTQVAPATGLAALAALVAVGRFVLA